MARRKAIVTGSDSGIGKATAVVLARHGCDVGITCHSDDAGARATGEDVEREGGRAALRRLDVSDHAAAPRIVEELIDELGGLDVFVNNAGISGAGPFLETSLDDWQRVLDVNLTGAFVCGQAAARHMVRQGRGGRIVNVTSVHELVPLGDSAAYCASKGGLGLLTKVMALELAPHGITVNAVAPGEVATAMNDAEGVDPHTQGRPAIPVGRPGHAREIAHAIAWLAGPESSYATGASFVVDGGLLLMAAETNRMPLATGSRDGES
jgi:NAD(P)-dependent dehydrogenase (short-subunit alcohol dehydrogenase family)